MVPAKLPTRSVTTSVKGRVCGPTPETLWGTAPAGGLKLMVGKSCPKAGVSLVVATKVWALAGSAKKLPWIVVEVTGWTSGGTPVVVTQVANELETGPSALALASFQLTAAVSVRVPGGGAAGLGL